MLTKLKKKLQNGEKIVLKIRVQTRAKRVLRLPHAGIAIMSDGSIKIKLKSTPENNKANQELIELLSDFFNVKTQQIKILSGQTTRIKLVEIHP